MFRIGEFSRIARVTIDTLRHYDALGLLKPVQVDPVTGYRYYTARQLKVLNRILALKDSGLSLDEIGSILQDNLSSEQVRGILKAQLVQAESDLQAAQARQEKLIARLNHLEMEENMPAYEVTLKAIEPTTVAAIRETIPTIEQMPARCGEMFRAIAEWMLSNGLPFGPYMTIYYNDAYTRQDIDTECAFIIPHLAAAQAMPAAPIAMRQMEAVPCVAYTVVTDDFYQKVDGLTPAYQALAQWIEDNGYQIVGPARELFYGSPQGGDMTAEVQFPVQKAAKA